MAARKKRTSKRNNMKNIVRGNAELGVTGLRHWSGRVNEEWLNELRGYRSIAVIKEMRDNDPIVGAILYAVDMLIRQVDWKITPFSDKPRHKKDAEFLESCMNDMSTEWTKLLSEILSFLPFGFSFHEIVYKKRSGKFEGSPGKSSKFTDGKIGWRKIPIRSQDTLDSWIFDENGDPKAFKQQLWHQDISLQQRKNAVGGVITIPFQRGLLFRTTSYKGNPQGRSVLRNAYRPWYFKKRIEEVEGIGIERDLAGLPVMQVPAKIMSSAATSDEQQIYAACKDIVTNIRRDEQEGIIIPGDSDANGNPLYSLKLLSTGGQRQFDTNAIVGRYDQRIAMTMLADFVLLGHEKVGSFALSDSKTSLFATAIGAWLDEIKAVFNRHAIPRLFSLNGNNTNEIPELDYGDIEAPDLTALGGFIRELAGAGATLFPDGDLEDYLRDLANLPKKSEKVKEAETKTREATEETAAETAEAGSVPEEAGGLPDPEDTDTKPGAPGDKPGDAQVDPNRPVDLSPEEAAELENPAAEKEEETKKSKKTSNGVCRFCKRAAKVKIVHSEGRAMIKVCSDHIEKGQHQLKTNGITDGKTIKLT